ncbi:MAG: hypothetical protein H3C35_01260 [Bacteroidetes bacterium]|nr:hypothetical protein [Bacteroidota bacterium]
MAALLNSNLAAQQNIMLKHQWNFPGVDGYRFPIVANNIPRYIFDSKNNNYREPTAVFLYEFIKKIFNADFTIIRSSFTPTLTPSNERTYYNNFLNALEQINRESNRQKISFITYDYRIKNAADYGTPAVLERIYDSRYCYGISVDEPKESEFSYFANWSQKFSTDDTNSWFNKKLFYVNIFGASAVRNYESYVSQWITLAKPRVLSYDNYPVWDDVQASKFNDEINSDWTNDFYYNLEIFRQKSVETNIPFWNWILVHKHWSSYSHRYYRRAKESDIRLQVYASLAYGCKGILYYNFWNPPLAINNNGWHEENAVLDALGNETDLYPVIATLNREILSIGDILLQLTSRGTYHGSTKYDSGKLTEKMFSSKNTNGFSRYGIKEINTQDSILSEKERQFKIVKNINNNAALIGIFEHQKLPNIFMIVVNKNRLKEEKFFIELDETKFLSSMKQIIIKNLSENGKQFPVVNMNGKYGFWLTINAGSGKLLEFTK